MVGGAWPFLVGGVICLVNSVNERDLGVLTRGCYTCLCSSEAIEVFSFSIFFPSFSFFEQLKWGEV